LAGTGADGQFLKLGENRSQNHRMYPRSWNYVQLKKPLIVNHQKFSVVSFYNETGTFSNDCIYYGRSEFSFLKVTRALLIS